MDDTDHEKWHFSCAARWLSHCRHRLCGTCVTMVNCELLSTCWERVLQIHHGAANLRNCFFLTRMRVVERQEGQSWRRQVRRVVNNRAGRSGGGFPLLPCTTTGADRRWP